MIKENKTGRKVMCLKNGKWDGPQENYHPKFSEILTIEDQDGDFISFKEKPKNEFYHIEHFINLLD